ncbi:MAG: NAD(P)H-dependent oxidoreductase [Arcobacter sp.]|jgi:putative NADPH-quinone reductase|uniref:NAD(P)H-dependent oxidoreductase n=1 Tax=unclassified Arcobacter TaxID=2593671 RepID=UPI00022961B9|nr:MULTISPECIES: NAD(P)H-dependent oxidoreductase [unclassified Arcobacter]MDY3200422.1 NAD(P)H-dependent oxidoreductase [Arcobacter sp.]BAK73545.1 conserved hypothetical protein [Arcobacter sp. L]
MKKVLVNLVHPNIKNSKVNKILAQTVANEENVTLNNLYEKYPDFKIDVEKEQKLLLENDIIIFQFPMYWLSSPALLKEWLDVTLTYNFAYGENYKLKGKILIIVVSTGASLKEFSSEGSNKFTVEEILNSFEAVASYINMIYQKPFITYETFVLDNEKLKLIANNYIKYIKDLSM